MDFREETIYFLLIARFFDGDPTNNRPTEWCSYPTEHISDPQDVAWRGDFKGLIQKLDYIQDLGFTAIWINPILHGRSPLDYHGYHVWDFTKVDPRLESGDCTFEDVVEAVHARGMKLVLDVVLNHSCRYGIKDVAEIRYNTDPEGPHAAIDNPDWQYDGLTANPDDGKIWSRANLATLPAPHDEDLSKYNWPNSISYVTTTDPDWFHHHGSGFAEDFEDPEHLHYRAMGPDLPALNTGSEVVRKYLGEAYDRFIHMGVDAFRLDSMKHLPREDVLYFADRWKAINPDVFLFGEVWQKQHERTPVEEIEPHYYTWRGAPCQSEPSGVSAIDFYLQATFHHVFGEDQPLSGLHLASRYDALYADPTQLVTWLDNHDFGPHPGYNRRFAGSPETLACALNFMFTWRGIPCVYYGTEIQFMAGAPTDVEGWEALARSLDETGRAYYGKEFEQAPAHRLYQHLQKLNALRRSIPALQKGIAQWDGEHNAFGISYRREWENKTVYVGLAKNEHVNFRHSQVPNGEYQDCISGNIVRVSNGILQYRVKPGSAGIYRLREEDLPIVSGTGYF